MSAPPACSLLVVYTLPNLPQPVYNGTREARGCPLKGAEPRCKVRGYPLFTLLPRRGLPGNSPLPLPLVLGNSGLTPVGARQGLRRAGRWRSTDRTTSVLGVQHGRQPIERCPYH